MLGLEPDQLTQKPMLQPLWQVFVFHSHIYSLKQDSLYVHVKVSDLNICFQVLLLLINHKVLLFSQATRNDLSYTTMISFLAIIS